MKTNGNLKGANKMEAYNTNEIETLKADIEHQEMGIALMESEGDTDFSMGCGDAIDILDDSREELANLI